MSKVRIVTDSSAHLTKDEIERYQIEVIPLRLRIGKNTYKEGVEITTDKYFEKITTVKTLPSTQPPLLQDFIDTYYRLSHDTDHIVSIHLSRTLNPAYDIARQAAASLRGHTAFTVIDSQTISRGLGMIVKVAAKAAYEDASLNEVARIVRAAIPSVFLSFFISDLAYPHRDGRIRKSQAILGSMLDVKPLMEIREGDLIVMEKVRTQFDIVEKLFSFISEFAYLEEIALLQHNQHHDATMLLERLEATYPDLPIFTDNYGPTLASYVGPSTLGVIVREAF